MPLPSWEEIKGLLGSIPEVFGFSSPTYKLPQDIYKSAFKIEQITQTLKDPHKRNPVQSDYHITRTEVDFSSLPENTRNAIMETIDGYLTPDQVRSLQDGKVSADTQRSINESIQQKGTVHLINNPNAGGLVRYEFSIKDSAVEKEPEREKRVSPPNKIEMAQGKFPCQEAGTETKTPSVPAIPGSGRTLA